jgi:hypothetical protein
MTLLNTRWVEAVPGKDYSTDEMSERKPFDKPITFLYGSTSSDQN